MEAIFLQLLNMSITASWLVLAVIVLRLLLKKAPKALFCVMWGLVAIRLLCPVTLESVWSLVPSAETVPQNIVSADVPMIESGVTFVDNTINPILTDAVMPDVTTAANPTVNPMQIVTSVASIVWIAGMAFMVLYMVISYLRIYLKVRESLWVTDNIFICDRIDTPFIFGLLRPRIYLPSAMQEGDKEYVIAHEKAHLSRHDHWWKPLGYLLLTVYWFNPILWVAYILLCKDIELACDEKVIQKLGVESKKSYADALINCSAPRKMITACPLAFGETGVKNRIKSVLNYKKPAFWMILIALIACVLVSVCFLTNPESVKLTHIDDGHGSDQFCKMFVTNPTITLVHGEQEYRVENNAPVLEELEKIRVRAKPISISRSEDRAQDYTIILNAGTGHEFYLCFNADFTEYWINDLVKPSQTYKVQNPSVVQHIFDTYMQKEATTTETPVPELTGTPLAADPKWLNNELEKLQHGETFDFTLEAYPDVTFRLAPYSLDAIENGETVESISGIIHQVYLADLNGDNRPEICAHLEPSGPTYTWVEVYDHATRSNYELLNVDESFWLTVSDNQLFVEHSHIPLDTATTIGNLALVTENGTTTLKMVKCKPMSPSF